MPDRDRACTVAAQHPLNRHLSYLEHIEKNGVTLAEIPECGHFPMYANPPAMWRAIASFLQTATADIND